MARKANIEHVTAHAGINLREKKKKHLMDELFQDVGSPPEEKFFSNCANFQEYRTWRILVRVIRALDQERR